MSRKPDGFVELLDDGTFNCYLLEEGFAIPVFLGKSGTLKPVCLVDPSLLDWVEKARTFLKEESKLVVADWLLDELNAILPEDSKQ